MDVVWLESKEIILMGDFNIDLSKTNKPWTDVFSLFNLSQTVSSPTRVTPSSKTLIDHIYSTDIAHILETCVPVIGVSDHYPICCTWSKKGVKIPKVGHSHLTYRSFARFDESEFLNDLNNAAFDKVYNHTDPDEALATWYSVFLKVLDKHAPRKRGESNIPSNLDGWHWKCWMQCVTEIIFLNWNYLMNTKKEKEKRRRNKVIYMIRNLKTNKHLFADILTNSKNSKDTWRAINLLTNKHAPANTSTTSGISPDDLNNHFCSVASKVIKTDNSPINELTLLE